MDARGEDEETLRLFAGLWAQRLEREDEFAERLCRDAFFWGVKVAKGEMLLVKAVTQITDRVRTVDETVPVFTYMLWPAIAEELATRAFEAGHQSVQRRRR